MKLVIQEMDLQMDMTLIYALNRANDAIRVKNGVVNDFDCMDAKYVAIVKVNHVIGAKESCALRFISLTNCDTGLT